MGSQIPLGTFEEFLSLFSVHSKTRYCIDEKLKDDRRRRF